MKLLNTAIRVPVLTLLILTAISGCQNALEPTPQGITELDKLFTTQNGILTAINGSYSPLLDLYNGRIQQLTDLASDDGWTWRNEIDPDVFIIQASSTYNQTVWVSLYQGVSRANAVIDNVDKVTNYSDPALRKAVEGQAKFIRAFYYFHLVRLFGGVPLILKQIGSRDDSEQPRAAVKDIYAQIKTDLTDAVSLLPATNSGAAGLEKSKPTSYTASALKALVHLELEEWADVKTSTTDIISKGALQASYASNFNGSSENGSGTFFEAQYGGVSAPTISGVSLSWSPTSAGGGAALLPTDNTFTSTAGGLASGNGIVQAYETGDKRKDVTIATYDMVNFLDATRPKGSLYYVNKYYNTVDPRGLSTWNFPLIRFAEILLTRAEAINEIGYSASSEAFTLLNQVRANAGLAPITPAIAADQTSLREAIRKERRIELVFECKRYFDLNRWGILQDAIQVQMNAAKRTFPSTRIVTNPITSKKYFLYPIPSTEFINNARLGTQNPGYN